MMSLLENDRWVAARELALLYAVSLGVLLLLDAAWLGWIAEGFYRDQLGSLLSASVSWLPAKFFLLSLCGRPDDLRDIARDRAG